MLTSNQLQDAFLAVVVPISPKRTMPSTGVLAIIKDGSSTVSWTAKETGPHHLEVASPSQATGDYQLNMGTNTGDMDSRAIDRLIRVVQEAMEGVQSMRMEAQVRIIAGNEEAPISVHTAGVFQEPDQAHIFFELRLGSESIGTEILSKNGRDYLNDPITGQWQQDTAPPSGPRVGRPEHQYTDALRELENISIREKQGRIILSGTIPAQHASQLSPWVPEELSPGETEPNEVTVRYWVDPRTHLVTRMESRFELKDEEGNEQETLTVEANIHFSAFNEPVNIEESQFPQEQSPVEPTPEVGGPHNRGTADFNGTPSGYATPITTNGTTVQQPHQSSTIPSLIPEAKAHCSWAGTKCQCKEQLMAKPTLPQPNHLNWQPSSPARLLCLRPPTPIAVGAPAPAQPSLPPMLCPWSDIPELPQEWRPPLTDLVCTRAWPPELANCYPIPEEWPDKGIPTPEGKDQFGRGEAKAGESGHTSGPTATKSE